MLVYVVRRLVWALMLCLTLSLVTFIIFYVIPTNRVRIRGGAFTDITTASDLNGTLIEQYGQFVWHALHGSLGRSFTNRREVTDILIDAAPVTISLTLGAAVLWMLIAVPVGVLAAMRPRSGLDRSATALVLIGLSVHPLWLGLLLSRFVGYDLGLLPGSGYCDLINPSTQCGGPVQWFTHLILPWITFAFVFAAMYVRMIRASVTETLQEDHVRSARSKGLSEWGVVRRHVMPVAVLPIVAMLAMDIGRFALPTAVFVETVFGLPGMGKVLYDSIQRNDLPVLVGFVVFTSLTIVVLTLIADLVHAMLDPRVKLRAEAVPA